MALLYSAGFNGTVLGDATMTTTGTVGTCASGELVGTYSHISMATITGASNYSSFGTAVAAALNSGGGSFTCTFNASTLRYTIAAGGSFQISAMNLVMKRLLGFDVLDASWPDTNSTSHTGTQAPWYLVSPEVAGRSNVSDDYEAGEVSFVGEADDGTIYGISRTRAPKYHDWIQPMEPKTKVFLHSGTHWTNLAYGIAETALNMPTKVWTYQQLFEHCRSGEPICVADSGSGGTYTSAGAAAGTEDDFICKLSAQGSLFKPARVTADYDGQWNIPFNTVLVQTSSGVVRK